MGNYLLKKNIRDKPFVVIESKIGDDMYFITYRYPNCEIHKKKMNYINIMRLAKKLKVSVDT